MEKVGLRYRRTVALPGWDMPAVVHDLEHSAWAFQQD
jgi:hypothetical protein